MKIKVIKNGYYVTEDLTEQGMIDDQELQNSLVHSLVVGDIWEKKTEPDSEGQDFEYFLCIEGKMVDEISEGMWEYEYVKEYFEIIK